MFLFGCSSDRQCESNYNLNLRLDNFDKRAVNSNFIQFEYETVLYADKSESCCYLEVEDVIGDNNSNGIIGKKFRFSCADDKSVYIKYTCRVADDELILVEIESDSETRMAFDSGEVHFLRINNKIATTDEVIIPEGLTKIEIRRKELGASEDSSE